MRIVPILLILLFLILPSFVFADCSKTGTTVIYINGIFGTEKSAQDDLKRLATEYSKKINWDKTTFINGFNESHVGGIDDLIALVKQMYMGGTEDYDLTKILRQIHSELKTQKIILLGYSQGGFYSNTAYDYLIKNGVDSSAIAVYNVGTLTDRVAGSGKYLNSSTDNVIELAVRELAKTGNTKRPLPANITLPIPEDQKNDKYSGHYFSKNYLAYAGDRIVSDIGGQISNLSATNGKEECFVEPDTNIKYHIYDWGYAVVDGAFENHKALATGLPPERMAWFANSLVNYFKEFGKSFASSFSEIVKNGNFWGAALTHPLIVDNTTSGGVEDNADVQYQQVAEQIVNNIVQDPQNELDDIEEKIDLIKKEIEKLIEQQKKDKPADQQDNQDNNEDNQGEQDNQAEQNNEVVNNSGKPNYKKLIISEVQVAGLTDEKQEFVELYNPNDTEVTLTDWYLQRKTANGESWSTYASNTLFNGKKILANGYFLIARQGYYTNLADIFVDNSITQDNSFALKNPNGEIADKLGFGSAKDPEFLPTQNPTVGYSMGRKVLEAGGEQETENNLNDFELQNLTPKSQNTTYQAPPDTPPKDISAPKVSFTIDGVQLSANFKVNFDISDIIGTTSPSGLAGYVFRWKEGEGTWNEDSYKEVGGGPSSANLGRDFVGVDGKTYYFQVKAKDLNANESDWQPETPATTQVLIPKKILINEIQIAGETAGDEFVELYNPNNVSVDLTGFSLKKKTSSGTESSLVSSANFLGIIPAFGYFLIAPQDNTDGTPKYTGSSVPDLRYSGKTYYISSDNTILLYGNYNNLLDKVGFGEAKDFETAPTINPGAKQSIERKMIGGDTDNNLNDFRVSGSATPKLSFMQAKIEYATSGLDNLAFHNGAYAYDLLIKWSSQSQDLDHFEVQYKINDQDWKDWLPSTTDLQGNFIAYYSLLNIENTYSFRVRSEDIYKNQSYWVEIDIDLSAPVVINELALYGTSSETTNKQWVELFNKTNQDIDLTGWKLFSDGFTFTLSGIIPANGYFLIENNESKFPTNYLKLLDKNQRFIDQVYNQANNNYFSLERISAYSLGNKSKNWKYSSGTPGQKNINDQLYTILPESFGVDTNMSKNLSPYFVDTTLNIFKGVVVSVEAGAVLKFGYRAGIMVEGALNVAGQADSKVVFTSWNDDEYLGDTNEDGAATIGQAGQWLGLQFSSNSKNSELSNVLIRYGGDILGDGWGYAIIANDASFLLKDSTIEKNKYSAVDLKNSNPIFDNVKILEHGSYNGINVRGGSPEIKNCYFYKNYYGVYLEQGHNSQTMEITKTTPIIQNNNFEQNNTPIYILSYSYPVLGGNSASKNQFNAIVYYPYKIYEDIILTKDLPYLIKAVLTVPTGVTMTIEPDVIVNFQDNWSGLVIEGTLLAQGTTGLPITFRPYYYDQPWIKPGNWLGLSFSKTSTGSILDNINISYGGNYYGGTANKTFNSAIKIDQCLVDLKNSIIENNDNTGLWLQNSASVIDGVTFRHHNTTTVGLSGEAKAIWFEGGSPEIKNCTFQNNKNDILGSTWTNPEPPNESVDATPNLHDNIFLPFP